MSSKLSGKRRVCAEPKYELTPGSLKPSAVSGNRSPAERQTITAMTAGIRLRTSRLRFLLRTMLTRANGIDADIDLVQATSVIRWPLSRSG